MKVTRAQILQLVAKLDEQIDVASALDMVGHEKSESYVGEVADLCSIADEASTLLSKLAAEKLEESH